MKYIFIRDDDVFKISDKFLKFNDILEKNAVPCMYAVIPGLLEKDCISFLLEKFQTSLITIAQHGYLHRNYGDEKNKYEFGPSRSYNQQFDDIKEGYEIMRNAFGECFNDVFVPPWHFHDDNTIKVINNLGFRGFSSDKIVKSNKFKNIPVHIEFNNDIKIISRLNAALSIKNLLGVLFHHEQIEDFKVLEKLIKYIKRLEIYGNIKIIKI